MLTTKASNNNSLHFNTNIIILDSEIKTSKKIKVEDAVGDLLFGRMLLIDAAGLQNSLRNKRDGYSFFGNMKEKVRN
jgi:hypothetical protein